MESQNEYYCPLIYNQLLVDHAGKLKHCCDYKSWFDTSSDLIEDKKKSIKKIENNQPIPGCQLCYTREQQNLPSLRQSEIASEQVKLPTKLNIERFDVRLHSDCNLACSMCNQYSSSLWAKMLESKQNFNLNQQVIDLILDQNRQIKKISFQGGEPFYGKGFTDFIDAIPNKSNIILEIFTNGLLVKSQKAKQWISEFKQTQIFISVDGHKEIYDYIRWPATWEKFSSKMNELYMDLKDHITFAFLLQNVNAKNLLDFLNWKKSECPLAKFKLSVCDIPQHFAPKIVSIDDKYSVIESLQKCLPLIDSIKAQMVLLQQINTIKNYNTTQKELDDFHKHCNFINDLRVKHQSTDRQNEQT